MIEIDEPEPPTPPYPPIPVEPEPDTPDDPEPIQPPYGPVVQCILHWLLLGGAAAVLVAILVMRKRNEAEIRELLEQESEVV